MDNHDAESLVSRIDADDMLSAMAASASTYKTMLALNNRLTSVCYGVVSRSAKYVHTEALA